MKKILFSLFLYFCVFTSFADEVTNYPEKLPTVWVWKVNGARLLYLAGEMHSFFDIEEDYLNYDFPYELYRSASAIYTEADALESNENAELSKIVGPDLWKEVDGVLRGMLNKTKIKTEKREYFHKSELNELNAQNPFVAYSNLSKLAHISYISSKKIKTSSSVGSYSKLLKLDGVNGVKKIRYLESSTVIEDVWSKNCGNEKMAQDLIKSALNFFNFDNFFNSNKKNNLQNAFFKDEKSIDDLLNLWLDDYPGAGIVYQCNVIPRNNIWIKKILELLEEKGDPVVVYVGLAHLAGKGGVINLLRENGFNDVERVYKVR